MMTKRMSCAVLLITVLISLLGGCSNKEGSAAEAYLDIAQGYVDEGDLSNAMATLKKGYEATEDDRIAVMMAELVIKVESEEPKEEAGEVLETVQPAEEEMESETVTSPEHEYTKAFTAVLKEAQESNADCLDMCEYALYDAFENGVPELIVKTGTCEADYVASVYIFENGTAYSLGTFYCSYGYICGIYGGDGLIMHAGQQGVERVEQITVDYGGVFAEEVYNGMVDEYHPFEPLKMYPLDDLSGLVWEGNPRDNNLETLQEIQSEVNEQVESSVTVVGMYDDVAGTYIDQSGYDILLFIGYEDAAKTQPKAYFTMFNGLNMDLGERDGDFTGGFDLGGGSEPFAWADFYFSPQQGVLDATIWVSRYHVAEYLGSTDYDSYEDYCETISFVKINEVEYGVTNPYYTD